MVIYVSFDGDGIGSLVGRARLADDVEEVRRVNQAIDLGNAIWRSWCESHGGSVIEIAGDEGAVELSADYLDELPKIRAQYADAVGASVSVGVGLKLSESAKALVAAKVKGKDQIVFYTEECDKLIEEIQKHPQSEEAKIADEYLSKASLAMHPGAFEGASRPSGAVISKPTPTQGEHSETQAAIDTFEASRPPAPEMTHAAKDFEDHFHEAAANQEREDTHKSMSSMKNIGEVKKKVAEALLVLKQQAPLLEQMKQAAPDAYVAVTGLAQAVIGLAREIQGGQPAKQIGQDTQKGEMKAEADSDDDTDLSKGKLPMPRVSAHHHVTLPAGSQLNGKVKVAHSDGTQSWVQVEDGQIQSQDPSGHPISSRNPNGR